MAFETSIIQGNGVNNFYFIPIYCSRFLEFLSLLTFNRRLQLLARDVVGAEIEVLTIEF
jgi:hypothetical protein